MLHTHNTLPRSRLAELDRFVVGQPEAKKCLVTALYDRMRRMSVPEPLRDEIQPKNVLMIGPTGVGKTEIARRLARITDSPFIKVEATKFTEVGYMGRDVEQMIRDLVDITIAKRVHELRQKNAGPAEDAAINKVREMLGMRDDGSSREEFLNKLKSGELDNMRPLEITTTQHTDHLHIQLSEVLGKPPGKRKTKKLKPSEAIKHFQAEELNNIDPEQVAQDAITQVENHGIVFIDEIDKICKEAELPYRGGVSREGVQRDLLPIVEGTEVQTKHGIVKTHHIFFIGSGAFQTSTPEDLLPELQGRFPVVVRMHSLTKEDFIHIISTKEFSLTEQYRAMLQSDNTILNFTPDGIDAIAEMAVTLNHQEEDIGARRLQGLLEHITHEIRFDVEKYTGTTIDIDANFVVGHHTRVKIGDWSSNRIL